MNYILYFIYLALKKYSVFPLYLGTRKQILTHAIICAGGFRIYHLLGSTYPPEAPCKTPRFLMDVSLSIFIASMKHPRPS